MGNNVTAEERDKSLSVAAENGEIGEVNKLLKKGADPNRKLADGERTLRTSLHRAAKTKNNVDVLTKLLTYIKDVDATDDAGNTALHLAAGYYNNAAVVQTLLHAKPNCKIQNNEGKTALHSAVQNGSDLKVVEMLLLAGSDPDIADFEGNTPLHLCAAKRGTDDLIAGILLRFGANPNIKNEEGQTPLHAAAKSGNKIVLLLLKFHAKVRVKDKRGRKASELTEMEDIKAVLEYEEECLEERTVRSEGVPSYMMSPRSHASDNEYNNFSNTFYHTNKGVSPRRDRTHFWAGDINGWKEYGGDAVFHLPDKSDIVVPPQALPSGTVIKLSIKPPKDREEELPVFDFDQYEVEFGIKIDLPGTILTAPWMLQSTHLAGKLPLPLCTPPAFVGMSTEGRNCWKSSREVACQPNGVAALNFHLSREKTKHQIPYKVAPPNHSSTVHVVINRSQSSSSLNDESGELPDQSLNYNEGNERNNESHSDTSSLSSNNVEDFKEESTDKHTEEIQSSSNSLLDEKEGYSAEHNGVIEMHEDTAFINSTATNEQDLLKENSLSNQLNISNVNESYDNHHLPSEEESIAKLDEKSPDEDHSNKEESSSSEDENNEKSLEILHNLQDESNHESENNTEITNNKKTVSLCENAHDEIAINEAMIIPEQREDNKKTDILTELARLENEESRYQHPIDPALATIDEDAEEQLHDKYVASTNSSSTESSGDELTAEDVFKFQSVSQV